MPPITETDVDDTVVADREATAAPAEDSTPEIRPGADVAQPYGPDDFASLTDEETEALGLNLETGEPKEPEPATAAPDTEAAPEKAESADPDPVPAETTPESAPAPEAEAPPPSLASFDNELNDLKAKVADLQNKLKDGDIEDDDFFTQSGELTTAIAQATADRAVAEQKVTAFTERWEREVGSYFEKYPSLKDDAQIQAFDARVREVTGSPDPAIQGLPMAKKLQMAHARLHADADFLGLDVPDWRAGTPPPDPVPTPATDPDPAPAAQPAPAEDAVKPPNPDAATPEPPKTVATIPAAAATPPGDGKFGAFLSVLSGTDSDAIEAALANMSDEERDMYASMDHD